MPTHQNSGSRDDNGEAYVLVGVVIGNPVGCRDVRVYPDFFTYIGHKEVSFKSTVDLSYLVTVFHLRSCHGFGTVLRKQKRMP